MKENKELNPNTLRPWSLQGCVRTCMCACVRVCACVTASLKGTPAQVSRQGSPHSRTVFWVHVKGNLSQMKYQARALARPVGEVTGALGEEEETLQTCMERTLGKLWPMGQGCVLY